MKISYGLTVCNEANEIRNLLNYLHQHIDHEDEIIVVYDKNRINEATIEVLKSFSRSNYKYIPFDFKQNFLENKNYLNSQCTGDYIFQIDADEIPNEYLLQNIKLVLESNPVHLLIVPRKNTVVGLTEEHIKKWGWIIDESGRVNWPDQQKRIYKNLPEIKWEGHQVHGMVEGYKTYAALPISEEWSIEHIKTINRQEKQNERYSKIDLGEIK